MTINLHVWKWKTTKGMSKGMLDPSHPFIKVPQCSVGSACQAQGCCTKPLRWTVCPDKFHEPIIADALEVLGAKKNETLSSWAWFSMFLVSACLDERLTAENPLASLAAATGTLSHRSPCTQRCAACPALGLANTNGKEVPLELQLQTPMIDPWTDCSRWEWWVCFKQNQPFEGTTAE